MAYIFSEEDRKMMDNLNENTTEPREFVEIPDDDYEVALESVKCKTLQPNDTHPEEYHRVVLEFKIIAGDYRGESIYYWQNLERPWMFQAAGRFLKSLKTDVDLSSARYLVDGRLEPKNYQAMLDDVYRDVIEKGYEYQLNVAPQEKNPKFKKWTIVDVFETTE